MSLLEITTYGRNTLRRLRREARLVAATPAPGLARACECDPSSPCALVSEYVPDVSLDDLVSIAPLPAAAALHALHDVARTLHAMHECGLVHGDLRPATVYVLPDGRAALAQPDDLPPATGSPDEDGRRSDARGFAMLAVELLTGDHPRDTRTAVARMTSLPALPRPAALALKHALTAVPARRPLPLDLVATLDAIPAEDWPTNHLRHEPPPPPPLPVTQPAPSVRRPDPPGSERWAPESTERPVAAAPQPARVVPPPTPPEPATPTSPVVVRIVPPPRRSRLRRVFETFVIMVGLATVLSGGGVGAWLLFVAPTATAGDSAGDPPQVSRIALTVTPPQAHCPRAVLHLAATIVTDGAAGDLVLQWRLPGGRTAETQRLSVDEGQTTAHAAIDLTLTGERQVVGDVVAVVSPGGTKATIPLRYLCPTGQKQRPDDSRSA